MFKLARSLLTQRQSSSVTIPHHPPENPAQDADAVTSRYTRIGAPEPPVSGQVAIHIAPTTPTNGLRWKAGRGLGDVRMVRILLQRYLPLRLADRILREADYYSAVAYVTTARTKIISEAAYGLICIYLNRAQRLSLAKVSTKMSGQFVVPSHTEFMRTHGPGARFEALTEYSFDLGGMVGELWLHRHYYDYVDVFHGVVKNWQSPDIIWKSDSDHLRRIRKGGTIEISARGSRYGNLWGGASDVIIVELEFYPNDVDYASFVLWSGM